MIHYFKYGKTIEITTTTKQASSVHRNANTREKGLPIEPRRIDSLRRTRRICLRRLLSAIEELGSPLFITLTFQGSASDVLYASNSVTKFQRRLRVSFPNAESLFIPEVSPKGRIHFHGLLFGVPQEWGNVKKSKRTISIGRERKERVFANLWASGFVDMLQTDGSPKLGYYLSKYVTKSGLDPLLSPIRLVRASRGFPKPVEFSSNENEEEVFDYLTENLKLRPVWENSTWTPYMGMVTKTFYDIL